ncbi:DNA-binding transcriptional regulator YbjK [Hamadaea flava]|uniref:TetR/AcrR family transcriptional regulator n=1 Tax=Hamadaea flava TaxID=1742688 RepID=A0ABV8M0K2_9ACTN|nr:TetR family transcriptional regulator C-terminal domain-containing protein [Hamadaea flava]MCP2329040.1 DNA-binding transcriptional regulator YbjK [Hamadaea flava]
MSAAPRRAQRPRDPQARRDALAAAVIDSIAEVGLGRTTHRSVANRAALPLGATTYYFPTLDDLIEAGLRQALDDLDRELGQWKERLCAAAGAADLAGELALLAAQHAADPRRVRVEYELYAAAMRDPRLRPLARRRLDGVRELLEPRLGGSIAEAVAALLDGVVLRAATTGEPVDQAALAAAVRRVATE